MTSTPKPIAEGSLRSSPFAHVLISAMRKQLQGTLAVWADDDRPGQDRILFDHGTPIAARFLDPAPSIDKGLLTLFDREKAPYAFYDVDLVGDKKDVVRGALDPLSLIALSLRVNVRHDSVAEVLRRLGDRPQRLKRGAPLARLDLQPNELAFIDVIRADPSPPKTLIESYGDPSLARRMLYLLGITDSLEPFRRESSSSHSRTAKLNEQTLENFAVVKATQISAPHRSLSPTATQISSSRPASNSSMLPPGKTLSGEIVAPKTQPPNPPHKLSPELKKKWQNIARFSSLLDRQNYFEMLGVKEASKPGEIRNRYLLLAKEWHPDRLPRQLDGIRSWVDEIFHLLTQARDTLSDATRRDEYTKIVVQGGGTPSTDRKLNALVDAAMAYEKVGNLLKRRQWDEALEIVGSNIAVAPKEPDYVAMKAWILLNKHGLEDEEHQEMITANLRKAFSLNPEHLHAHFVKATFHKRLGDHARALIHFKKVADLDPRNLEAVREVRIANMRKARGRSSAPPPGHKRDSIFGKFFTGKKK